MGLIREIYRTYFKTAPDVCLFCGKENELSFVTYNGIYSGLLYYYYHPSCLNEVSNDPEVYGSKKVDYALAIQENIEWHRVEKQRKFDKLKILVSK